MSGEARRPVSSIAQVTGLQTALDNIEAGVLLPLAAGTQKLTDAAVMPTKTNFFDISTNLVDHRTVTAQSSLSATTGLPVYNASNSVSAYVPITPSTVYTSYRCARKAFYTSDYTFISSDTSDGTWTTPANAYYMRMVASTVTWGVSAQLNLGNTLLPFELYNTYLKDVLFEPKSITTALIANSARQAFITAGVVDFDFIANLVKFVNLRLVWDSGVASVLVNQNLDISALGPTFVQVLYYDTATSLLGSTPLSGIPSIPATALPLGAFRMVDQQVYGLERYSINGVPKGAQSTPTDHLVIDTEISAEFTKNATIPDGSATIGTSVSADLHTLYDALVTAYPTYITRTLLGNEPGSNLPIYCYDFSPVKPSITDTVKQPKVIISAGTHNEKTGAWTLYNTLENICNHWADDPLLQALRFNVRFLVVPVASPWAFDNNSRTNSNGVDIARNFPKDWVQGTVGSPTYGGTAPLSEVEAQVMNTLILANLDAVGLVDVHNFAATDGLYIMGNCDNDFTRNISQAHIQRMSRKWRAANAFINQSHDVFVGHNTQVAPNGSSVHQAGTAYGIPGAIAYEVAPKIYADGNSVDNDSNALTFGYEALVNFLLMFIDHLSRHL